MIRVDDRIESRAAGQGRPVCGFDDLDRFIRFYIELIQKGTPRAAAGG